MQVSNETNLEIWKNLKVFQNLTELSSHVFLREIGKFSKPCRITQQNAQN